MVTTNNIALLATELGRAMAEMRNNLRREILVKIRQHDIDISFELLEVLVLLYQQDGINQQEIAARMIKDKSSMTYLINMLVKRNMVQRKAAAHDRRNKLIFLTAEGKALRKKLNPWVIGIYKKATIGIKAAQIQEAVALVQQMNHNLNK